MRTCRNADIRMGERILVIGAGIVGQTAAQIATAMGARTTICDIDDRRLETAKQIGAVEEALNVSGDGWEQNIPNGSFDVLIDVAGVPGMEDKLIAAARQRGRVMFIAGRSQVNYNFNQGQGREITIKQNSHFDRDDLANLCRLVISGMVNIDHLIRDVVPVSEAGSIYDKLRDTPAELHGTVFVW
jgi:2-desacetyl-2-hydroxyethyl bacteriochlorophyllide A dehydrogenase